MPAEQRVTFFHSVLTGTAREAGRRQGERIARDPGARAFCTSPHPERGPLAPGEAARALAFFDRHCPGLNEELAGFAEALAVPPEQIVFYALSWDPPGPGTAGHCSHAVVRTSDGHVRVVRNYEFSPAMSDLRLATTRIEGRAAHIGFSEVLFGRDDGLNEHGLCVTMSAGAPMAPVEPGGCRFWPLVRTILDRCACVDDALEVIAEVPLSFNVNLLLADRSGKGARVELASSRRAVRRGEAGDPDLVATNHFEAPELAPWDLGRRWNSVMRRRVLRERLFGQDAPDPRALREVLADPYPRGVCCHDYRNFFGTLWSEVFDVTTGTVEVCFGSPARNPWRSFDLGSAPGWTPYPVVLPDEPADAAFWRKLDPGCEA